MPDALRLQMGHIREAAECFGVPTISVYGTEADDLIATAVARATTEGVRNVCVVSSDKDLLQLVTPAGGGPWSGESTGATNARTNVTVFDDRKKLLLDAAAVRHKFHGVEPAQVVDYLALVGDASDNVPGIPGIGPKTAAALLIQFGSLEGVLAAAPAIKKSKRRDALIEFGDVARLGKQLIVLDSALETVSPASLRGLPQLHPADLPHLRPFLQEHGFLQLERRLYIAREEIAARQLKRAIS
jgi:DNA polymerase-1